MASSHSFTNSSMDTQWSFSSGAREDEGFQNHDNQATEFWVHPTQLSQHPTASNAGHAAVENNNNTPSGDPFAARGHHFFHYGVEQEGYAPQPLAISETEDELVKDEHELPPSYNFVPSIPRKTRDCSIPQQGRDDHAIPNSSPPKAGRVRLARDLTTNQRIKHYLTSIPPSPPATPEKSNLSYHVDEATEWVDRWSKTPETGERICQGMFPRHEGGGTLSNLDEVYEKALQSDTAHWEE